MIETSVVAFDDRYAAEIRAIRNKVFTDEQHFDAKVDFDGRDPSAVHVLAACEGRYVGTGRLLPDGHIGRLAVLSEYRGRGVGANMVQALVSEAEKAGLTRVFLGAQMHAVSFYERLGFVACGAPFTEAGVEHLPMERLI